jgi:putrescine aminotransferase
MFGEVTGGLDEVMSAGAWVFTSDGRRLLDCGGYGVFLHGHRHPKVVAAVVKQIERHPMATRVLLDPVQARAAQTLANECPGALQHVHFVNSGAEATEAALKLARALGRRHVVATFGAFHGKTMGALSVTANPTYRDPFRPLLPDIEHVAFGDAASLERAVAAAGGPVSVIVEPVQGEAGVIMPTPGYLTEVQRICRSYDALLIVDEVQTGLGRLGTWWGVDAEGVEPDIMLVGKGLSGGVIPVAAVVATPQAYQPFDRDPFLHSSTFAGSPVAAAAATAAVEVLREEGLVERSLEIGDRLQPAVRDILTTALGDRVVQVRGRGLLIGVEFDEPGVVGELILGLLDAGVVVNSSLNNNKVLRFTPPAVLTPSDENALLRALSAAATATASRLGHQGSVHRDSAPRPAVSVANPEPKGTPR